VCEQYHVTRAEIDGVEKVLLTVRVVRKGLGGIGWNRVTIQYSTTHYITHYITQRTHHTMH
jgi:hypothetical protein